MTDFINEQWRDIQETKGLYQVSDFGRVKRNHKQLKPSSDSHGYYRVSLSVNGKVTVRYIHRLVLDCFDKPREQGMEGRHLNGICTDNRLVNLAWGTKSENMQDAIRHGTFPLLEKRPGAKLTRQDAIDIFTSKKSSKELATIYGVGIGVIRQVKTRETWQSVTENLVDADWNYKPKHSSDVIRIAIDRNKTRQQIAIETGLTIYQIKRLRKLYSVNPPA